MRTMEWVDGNLGTQADDEVSGGLHDGPGARGEILSIAFAGRASTRTPAARWCTSAPHTSSQIISQVDLQGWRPRQLSRPGEGRQGRARRASPTSSATRCCSTRSSRSDTYPYIEIDEEDVTVGHEASVARSAKSSSSTCMSRGLTEDEASAMIVVRLHRAAGQGTADGIRRRDEPADPVADGRLGRVDGPGR